MTELEGGSEGGRRLPELIDLQVRCNFNQTPSRFCLPGGQSPAWLPGIQPRAGTGGGGGPGGGTQRLARGQRQVH